jgi:hypothetical protein
MISSVICDLRNVVGTDVGEVDGVIVGALVGAVVGAVVGRPLRCPTMSTMTLKLISGFISVSDMT